MASARIRCAALVGANMQKRGLPRHAEVFPVTMIAPLPCSSMSGATLCVSTIRAVVLIRNSSSKRAGSASRMVSNAPCAALCTATQIEPSSSRALAAVFRSRSRSLMSHTYPREPGISFSRRLRRSSVRASIAMRYPSDANRRAVAAPIPSPAPVIRHTGSAMYFPRLWPVLSAPHA